MKLSARFLALAAVVLAAIALTACGGSSSSSSSSTSANAATSAKSTGATGAGASTTGSTTGSTGTGTTGSTQAGTNKRHVKKATAPNSPKIKRRVAAGRVKLSALRRCLEENGVKTRSGKSKGATGGHLAEALKRCGRTIRTALPQTSKQSSAVRRQLLARPAYRQALARFTRCMRTHGVPNFPEANTSGKGPLFPAGGVKPSPKLRAAQRACIGQLSFR